MTYKGYRDVYSDEFVKGIKACVKLTKQQEDELLGSYIRDKFPYRVIVSYPPKGTNAWWRLSVPLLFIVTLLLRITVCPINYVLTGYSGIDSSRNKFFSLIADWAERCGV